MSDTTPESRVAPETSAAWMRAARGAAVTTVAWSVLVHLFARELIPPVLVIGVLFLGFALFLRGERRRLGYVLAGVAAFAVLGNAPFVIGDLTSPDSTPAFVLTLLQVCATAVAVVSGLAMGRGWKTVSIRPVIAAAMAVFLVGTIGSVVAGAAAHSDEVRAGDVAVVAERTEFRPDVVAVQAGAAGFWIDNKDGIRHTFTVEELGIDLEVPALKARRIDLDIAPGVYQVICTVPGHEKMTASLTVTP